MIATAIALPLACLLAVPFFRGWPAKRFLIFYFAPIISMAAVWASLKIRTLGGASGIGLAIDGVVFCAAMARFLVGEALPFSGHMLFFAHTFLTIKEKWYKALALLFMLETTYFKLLVWSDPKTWLNGMVSGIASGVTFWVAHRANAQGHEGA